LLKVQLIKNNAID